VAELNETKQANANLKKLLQDQACEMETEWETQTVLESRLGLAMEMFQIQTETIARVANRSAQRTAGTYRWMQTKQYMLIDPNWKICEVRPQLPSEEEIGGIGYSRLQDGFVLYGPELVRLGGDPPQLN
jgi:hypothetical protein